MRTEGLTLNPFISSVSVGGYGFMGKGPDTEEWKTRIASNAKVWSRPQISRSFFGGFCSSYPAVYGCGSFGRAPPGERSETRFPRATATVKR